MEFSLDDPFVEKAPSYALLRGKWHMNAISAYTGKPYIHVSRLTEWAIKNGLVEKEPDERGIRKTLFYSFEHAKRILEAQEAPNNIHIPIKQLLNTKQLAPRNSCHELEAVKEIYEYRMDKIRCGYYSDYCSDGERFVTACIEMLKQYFELKYMAEFSAKNISFDDFVTHELARDKRPLSAKFFTFQDVINRKTLNFDNKIYTYYHEKVPKYRACYFIKKIGPEKALQIIKKIIYEQSWFKRRDLMKKLDSLSNGVISKKYRVFKTIPAKVSNIEDEAFIDQFNFLEPLEFSQAEKTAIINKISTFSKRQIIKYALPISLFFLNEHFQPKKLRHKNLYNCALRIFQVFPTEGAEEGVLNILFSSTIEIITSDPECDAYDVFWPKIGSMWPIENRQKIEFKNSVEELIFDTSVEMLVFSPSLETRNPELAKYIEQKMVFEPPYEKLWFQSFMIRNKDLGYASQAMLDKFISEIRGGELIPKEELMDKLCLVFAQDTDKILDELLEEDSPLRGFSIKLFESMFKYADDEKFDGMVRKIIENFDEIITICGKKEAPKILQLARLNKDKILESTLEDFEEIIKSKIS